ncbi:MAG: hypothetical protein WBW84_17520 [Acidobacteriaceae bacterium]
MVAVDAKPMLEAEARERQLRGTANLKRGKERPGLVKSDKTGEPVHVRDQVAKQFEVSQGYVHAATKIKEIDEGVAREVKNGTLTIPEAQEKLGLKNRMKGQMSSESNEWCDKKSPLHQRHERAEAL